jgi:hypothetical protein
MQPEDMEIGKKINIRGPVSFALYPGQMAKVIRGHALRTNQYLLARVYEADAANHNQGEVIDAKGNKVENTVTNCVIATNQTYVEALKKNNAFTAEAQKEAFNLTYNAVMAILTEDAKEYLAEIYGDVAAYITNKIEAEVNISKIVPAE